MIMIRTVPNIMDAYACSADSAQRYIDLREEGYSSEQAKLMAGLSDPPDPDDAHLITDPHAGVLGHASEDPELVRQCAASGQMSAAQMAEHGLDRGAEIRYLGDLQRLAAQPGDVFILSIDRPVSRAQHEAICEYWKSATGDVKLLVLDAGMRLAAVGTAAARGTQEVAHG